MKQLFILIIFLICSCRNVKTFYLKGELDPNGHAEKNILQKLNADTNDKSVIVFTSGFDNDTIKIISGSKNIFEKSLKTDDRIGFSTLSTINNEEKIEVQIFTGNLIQIFLKQKDLKKYKFVYISRSVLKKNKYKLEYSNKWKKFR